MKSHKVKCSDCGKNFLIKVSKEAMEKFNSGTPVQIAMPDLDTEKQTMLLGKRCKQCMNIALAA